MFLVQVETLAWTFLALVLKLVITFGIASLYIAYFIYALRELI